MNRFIIILLLYTLTNCQSAPKTDSEDAETSDIAQAELTPERAVEKQLLKKDILAKQEIQKPQSVSSSVLDEAIRSQNEEAIYKAATSALSQNPKDLKAQNALGLYHYRKGHFLAAEYFFTRAIVGNPGSSDLHNNLGLVRLALKEKRDAILYFKKAFELNNNPIAAANIGAIYTEEKDYNKALVALEIAIKKGPRDYNVLNNYGIALAATGKFEQSKEQYQDALKLNSTGREAMFNLAALNIEQLKNYQEGLDLLNKLKFLGPPESARLRLNVLENKAKAGLK